MKTLKKCKCESIIGCTTKEDRKKLIYKNCKKDCGSIWRDCPTRRSVTLNSFEGICEKCLLKLAPEIHISKN